MHFHISWAKQQLDEVDATLVSFEGAWQGNVRTETLETNVQKYIEGVGEHADRRQRTFYARAEAQTKLGGNQSTLPLIYIGYRYSSIE